MQRILGFVAMLTMFGLLGAPGLRAQDFSGVVVWSEAGLPTADSAAPSPEFLAKTFPQSKFAATDQLAALLLEPQTRLLMLPEGSVVPENAWPAIYGYLRRGGNLLVLGGRPFLRAAYRDNGGWHLRDESVRFLRPLLIDQYQVTPGSEQEEFVRNPDIPVELPKFSWQRAFSPVIRLSSGDLYRRGGSAGYLDARVDPLVWGETNGRRMSAPILEIDHVSSGFDGGRWIFLCAELPTQFYSSSEASRLLRALGVRAMNGAVGFSLRPSLPLYLPGEPVELETDLYSPKKTAAPMSIQLDAFPEERPAEKQSVTIALPLSSPPLLSTAGKKGLQIIEARLFEGTTLRAVYHSAFWIRDEEFLRSGPRLGVNSDYFTVNGKPLAVVGTTYMSSEVQRLYFDHPNVYVWNRDFSLIRSVGLNMVRSGWWTGWDKLCDETGRPYERTLRTLEAYLMTARKYEIPVQFNFFAFLPDVLGGANAYLDAEAVRRQQELIGSIAGRFHEAPFVAWDLINEPSFSSRLWMMRPNGDAVEQAAWNEWLAKRYPDRAALAAAWNVPPDSVEGQISLPAEQEFSVQGMYGGVNSLRVYDYYLFAQEKFTEWVRGMRETIRASGSAQPITVGQDEGGNMNRLSPAFFAPYVDFTTSHSWWQNDSLLWDSLVAKQPGRAMLIQETGLQRELNLDELARRTPEQEAMLFERKFILSFAQGAGAIEWLWNSNAYMTDSNETPIGALRADGTEKPEAAVLRGLAKFAAAASPYLREPKQVQIAVVTSQAAQFSVFNELQVAAQQSAVRALSYQLHQPCYFIAENQIEHLGAPKLVILPSAQALREETWQALLAYAKKGGNLLVTGAVARDEHWHVVDRLSPLGIKASLEPLTMHAAGPETPDGADSIPFDQQKQMMLEYWKFADGVTEKKVAVGQGNLFLEAYPVELARDSVWAGRVYEKLLQHLAIEPPFTLLSRVGPGLLIYPIELRDSVLYLLESESDQDTDVSLQDSASGGRLQMRLLAQRGAMAVIEKRTKSVVAQYGF